MTNEFNWDELGINPDEEVGVASSDYIPPSQFPPPPTIGNYDVAGVMDTQKWGRDKDKNLWVRGDFVIVGGEFDGKKVSAFINNRLSPFRQNGTDMEDFVRGAGVVPANGNRFTAKELKDGVDQTWTAIRKGFLNWEGYCKECGKTVARGKNGAKNEKDGFRVIGFLKGEELTPTVLCPLCGSAVQARGVLQRFYIG